MGATAVRLSKNAVCGILGSKLGWLLFPLALFLVYLSTGQPIGSPDNISLRYLPLSLIREGNFDLNEFSFLYAERVVPYSVVHHDGYFLPFAPVGPALLAVPFYLIPALAGFDAASPWAPYVEKVAASGIAALSALCLLLTLARLVPTRRALVTALLYAFGTATFGVSSQALWPVGSAQLMLAMGLYCVTRGRSEAHWTAYAAIPLSWAVLCRPSSALIGLLVGIYVFIHCRRQFLVFILLAMPALVFQGLYNAAYFGDPFRPPGYMSSGGHLVARLDSFNTPLWRGLAGLLFSPAVGFFVYSPIYLCALAGIYRRWRAGDPLVPYLAGGALSIMLLQSRLNMWWGGAFLGPRYVIEVAPILTYFLAFGLAGPWQRWRKMIVSVLAVWSVYTNSLMAFAFDGSWDHRAELWSWSNNPIAYYSCQSLQRGSNLLLWAGERVRQGWHELPDSRSHSGLEAIVEIETLPTRMSTNAFIDVVMQVKNAGQAIWLHGPPDDLGTVRPAWRWFKSPGRIEAQVEGRGPLLTVDLLPGRQARLLTRIWTPPEAGLYELELGMVSEQVAWFGGGSGPPTRATIEVTGESMCRFEPALAVLEPQTGLPLDIQWTADQTVLRADEVLSARLNMSNAGPPRVLYPVIILRWPSGVYRYWDFALARFQDLCPTWYRPQWPLFIDHGYRAVDYPILSLLLADMPVGSYTLYFLYLQAKDSTVQLAANASLTFERLP
jgi:hypothetical protein